MKRLILVMLLCSTTLFGADPDVNKKFWRLYGSGKIDGFIEQIAEKVDPLDKRLLGIIQTEQKDGKVVNTIIIDQEMINEDPSLSRFKGQKINEHYVGTRKQSLKFRLLRLYYLNYDKSNNTFNKKLAPFQILVNVETCMSINDEVFWEKFMVEGIKSGKLSVMDQELLKIMRSESQGVVEYGNIENKVNEAIKGLPEYQNKKHDSIAYSHRRIELRSIINEQHYNYIYGLGVFTESLPPQILEALDNKPFMKTIRENSTFDVLDTKMLDILESDKSWIGLDKVVIDDEMVKNDPELAQFKGQALNDGFLNIRKKALESYLQTQHLTSENNF
jgi:hypothetical protein